MGIEKDFHNMQMKSIPIDRQFRVLLCQALFGHPEALLLDEPTNHLDLESISWLEEFLKKYTGTVIVISHDRYFLNTVTTHIADIDYDTMIMYPGNYDEMIMAKTTLRQTAEKEENREQPPTFEDVKNAVNHAYKSTGQEVPEEILKRFPVCNEQTTTQDPIKEVLHSCGEVGSGIRDIIENTKDLETRNRLIPDLKTVERYTMVKIDEYGRGSKLGKLPDPQHIEGFKNLFKETYFTVRPQKP